MLVVPRLQRLYEVFYPSDEEMVHSLSTGRGYKPQKFKGKIPTGVPQRPYVTNGN